MEYKLQHFSTELGFIEREDIRKETENLIGLLPDYFFSVPASSTGKYHPDYALENEGLLRHTQAAVRIAHELLRLEMFNGLSEKKDFIYAALILHDGLKHGKDHSPYSVANHPLLAANFIVEHCESLEIGEEIADLVATHMGQWNTDYRNGLEIMQKPSTKAQSFVHLCDYLASRKFLEFNFGVYSAS